MTVEGQGEHWYKVRLSDAVFAVLGLDVDWGQPDEEGFYTPTIRESGPGFARINSTDTPEQIEQKMADAFAPVRAMREALADCDCPGRKYGGHQPDCPRREARPFA